MINTQKENLAFACAMASMLIIFLTGAIFAANMNDGSIPGDWYNSSYWRAFVISVWTGIVAFAGIFGTIVSVVGVVFLLTSKSKKKSLYVLNLVAPLLTVVLFVISSMAGSSLPNV